MTLRFRSGEAGGRRTRRHVRIQEWTAIAKPEYTYSLCQRVFTLMMTIDGKRIELAGSIEDFRALVDSFQAMLDRRAVAPAEEEIG